MTEQWLRGLFVGVNFYANKSNFRSLNYAVKDAKALHALFMDNCTGESNLVLDGEATKEKILTEIRHLACDSTHDNTVVIAFSGHGSTSGELVPHDANINDMHDSAIPLELFVEEVSKITARRVLVMLDCCFVGGELAKAVSRRVDEDGARAGGPNVEQVLGRITGRGRLVLAASGEGQIAYEGRGTNHGLLTHYFIQGLLGEGVPVERDKISLLHVASSVMRRVSAHPRLPRGIEQNPTLSAQIDDEIRIPKFTKGPRYNDLMQGTALQAATPVFSSLAKLGLPDQVIAVWKTRMPKLNTLQLEAVNMGELFSGQNLVVSAPTSSGKTMIGEMAAIRSVAQGGRAVFLLPTRALVNEQYERFVMDYQTSGIRTVRATGELRDQVSELLAGKFDLAVCTYEKFIGLLHTRPDLFSRINLLVVDEIQSIMLPDRGPQLEMLLTWARPRLDREDAPQVIGLTTSIKGCGELAEWLGAALVASEERPTPLREGMVWPGGGLLSISEDGKQQRDHLPNLGDADGDNLVIRLVKHLTGGERNDQVIVFRSTRRAARNLARELARHLGFASAETTLAALPRGDEGRLEEQLRDCLGGGVAFHLSDLDEDVRRVIEKSYRRADSEIRVLIATTTLALGVNLPADSVIVCELEHPSGQRYSVSEYDNMAGRAGRTGWKAEGHAYIVAANERDAIRKVETYIQAEPDPLRSAMRDDVKDLRDTILSIIAGPSSRPVDVRDFLRSTFASFQTGGEAMTFPFSEERIEAALTSLRKAGLVRAAGSGLALTQLGAIAARTGLSVESVTILAEALAEVPLDAMSRMTLICAAQLAKELEDKRFTAPNGQPRKLQQLTNDMRGKRVADTILKRMSIEPVEGDSYISRARRSVACFMWTQGVLLTQIEQRVSLSSPYEDVHTHPIRQAAQRAADFMNAVIEIAMCVNPAADFGMLPDTLPTQLEQGIRGSLVPIARASEVRLPRVAYLRLIREGFTSVEGVLAADPAVLRTCLEDDDLLQGVLAAAERAKEAMEQEAESDGQMPPTDD
ncbi:DEAD/DEAH box helicase [Acrocarpospora catenulata]|uniref:DEAD/DEAH box helicase n=1 Tax=Acrocarpospora catenulata TaxID=2836182 RepID=UPI001BDB6AC0|nr:DEAD/DEAH box helicase [Acrocarpospora catenulata]